MPEDSLSSLGLGGDINDITFRAHLRHAEFGPSADSNASASAVTGKDSASGTSAFAVSGLQNNDDMGLAEVGQVGTGRAAECTGSALGAASGAMSLQEWSDDDALVAACRVYDEKNDSALGAANGAMSLPEWSDDDAFVAACRVYDEKKRG